MSNLKFRLTVLNFFQFFVWGAWLISMGGYMSETLGFTGGQVGKIYATMGIASLFMPAIMGIIADKWLNAERVLGICHLLAASMLLWATTIKDYDILKVIMLFNAIFYMPTIALNNTVSYNILEKNGFDIVKSFPPIRVWGTVGFIAAMWTVDLSGWTLSPLQLYVSAASGIFLGLYAFTLPPSPPAKTPNMSLGDALGFAAFKLFKKPTTAVFFVFAMFFGASFQITNAFGISYMNDFKELYANSFGVQHPNLLLSISQISETLFILTIPFFLRRFGIRTVMMISMLAWVLRFGLFAYGDPGPGLWMLVLSMIVYGMAFDFFNISGSLFVEREADEKIRASAQGLFMLMTNGLGAFIGGVISGWVVDQFTTNGVKDWQSIWLSFAGYALVLLIVFPFVFKYKKEVAVERIKH